MGGDDSDVLVLAVSEKALVQGAVPSSGEGGSEGVSTRSRHRTTWGWWWGRSCSLRYRGQ